MTTNLHEYQESPLTEGDIHGAAETAFDDKDALQAACREQICPTCTVQVEAEDVRLRALAEMENFKKRLQRDKEEQVKYAAESVLGDLVPVLDNLDLAIQYGSRDEACKDLLTGVAMTRKLFMDALKTHGLMAVGATGEDFDPDVHEAVAHEERTDMEPGKVATLLQQGYKLKDRLLRPAKVAVSRHPVEA